MNSLDYARKNLDLSWCEILDELQGRERQAAMAVWDWACWHSEGAAPSQDRYYRRYGQEATVARINKVRVWIGLEPLT